MAILTVGVGGGFDYGTLAGAIAASSDGDVIEVQAGTYTNDFATITTKITIEGVGGMVNLVATVPPPNLKAILTTTTDVTLDNIAFSGAAISDADGGNAAGVRYEGGNLVINNCYFHDNQEGLLAGASPTGTITINNSEFADNGNASGPNAGYTHDIYVGDIQQLTIDNSYFHDAIMGHDIKSRAENTTIENSRITSATGSTSYEIDLPNGGNAIIANNVIEKGPNAQNPYFISYGEEGGLLPGSLSVTGNTVINNDPNSSVTLVHNVTTIPASISGNTIYGLTSSQISSGPVASPASNSLQDLTTAPALDTSQPFLPVLAFSFPCFARGTLILTTEGEVSVEALQIGQRVVTAAGGRPIRWIGRRRIDLLRHPDPRLVRPLRVRRDAIADNQPRRDLLLSPDHAIFLDGGLIPVRLLLNGGTIVRETQMRSVAYFHVELDAHDIIFADGLASESYLDTGNRNTFENAGLPLRLRPDLAGGQAVREALSCAPLVTSADEVEPVWRRLAVRARLLGYRLDEPATTQEPLVRLRFCGQEHAPVAVDGQRYTFVVSPGHGPVRLVSRATAPCDVFPWVEDRRRLGVAVLAIKIGEAGNTRVIPPDHPTLTAGWWDAECSEGEVRRWTDGDALLPAGPSAAVIEIQLAGHNTYIVETVNDQPVSGQGAVAG